MLEVLRWRSRESWQRRWFIGMIFSRRLSRRPIRFVDASQFTQFLVLIEDKLLNFEANRRAVMSF